MSALQTLPLRVSGVTGPRLWLFEIPAVHRLLPRASRVGSPAATPFLCALCALCVLCGGASRMNTSLCSRIDGIAANLNRINRMRRKVPQFDPNSSNRNDLHPNSCGMNDIQDRKTADLLSNETLKRKSHFFQGKDLRGKETANRPRPLPASRLPYLLCSDPNL